MLDESSATRMAWSLAVLSVGIAALVGYGAWRFTRYRFHRSLTRPWQFVVAGIPALLVLLIAWREVVGPHVLRAQILGSRLNQGSVALGWTNLNSRVLDRHLPVEYAFESHSDVDTVRVLVTAGASLDVAFRGNRTVRDTITTRVEFLERLGCASDADAWRSVLNHGVR